MNGKLHMDKIGTSSTRLPEVQDNKPGHYIATLTVILLPFVGLAIALPLAWFQGWLYTSDIVMMVLLHLIAAGGITIGFHRLLTHRSFATKSWLRSLFAAAGSLAVEGTPVNWVADHRCHHDFTDVPGDPHSPHVGFEKGGFKAAFRGAWHAHWGWLLGTGQAPVDRYANDLLRDAAVMRINRLFPWFVGSIFVVPMVLGFVVNGFKWQAALTGLLWAGVVRMGITHHITWSVNSICHMFGKRPYELEDKSTNNWLLAVPTLGEAWHHNHHAFPTSARHGLTKGQIDVSWWCIKLLEKLHLAWDIHVPTPQQIKSKEKLRPA